jgi:hypothetical protein
MDRRNSNEYNHRYEDKSQICKIYRLLISFPIVTFTINNEIDGLSLSTNTSINFTRMWNLEVGVGLEWRAGNGSAFVEYLNSVDLGHIERFINTPSISSAVRIDFERWGINIHYLAHHMLAVVSIAKLNFLFMVRCICL